VVPAEGKETVTTENVKVMDRMDIDEDYFRLGLRHCAWLSRRGDPRAISVE
jgi:hypothetical protein